MPINQETSITEGNRALGLFTNRLNEQRLFARYLHAEPPREQILFFYGDGGNGKSLLLKLLKERYCKRLPEADWRQIDGLEDNRAFVRGFEAASGAKAVPYVYHDLSAPDCGEDRPREDWAALLMLRRELGSQGLKFPLFDFAVIQFLHKTHQLSAEHTKNLFPQEEANFIGSLINIITDSKTPFIGLAIQVITLFDNHLKTRLAVWRAQLGLDEETIQELQRLDPRTELRDRLPGIFAGDLNTAMQLLNSPERVVLFFDTHESFWGTERILQSTDAYFQRDEWLRRLLAGFYKGNVVTLLL